MLRQGRAAGVPGEKLSDRGAEDIDEGGAAIPYSMEDPHIRQEFEATLKKNGLETAMDPHWYEPGVKTESGRRNLMTEEAGGRIFFSTRGQRLLMDDEIRLTSVGVDIGSSTSHLVFSQITLERVDARYVVSERKVLYQSDILLTPYLDDQTIDDGALRLFVDSQYKRAGISPADIDTGALVLTGVAVRRANARSIADVFAREAGKMVAVSAGDSLETIMSAYGSGAVARSLRERRTIVNVDIGGGTSKIAVCANGQVIDRTAVDIGARIIAFDADRRIQRIEEAGKWFARRLGVQLAAGDLFPEVLAESMAEEMARCLLAAMGGEAHEAGVDALLRLDPLGPSRYRRGDDIGRRGGIRLRQKHRPIRRPRAVAGGVFYAATGGRRLDSFCNPMRLFARPWLAQHNTPRRSAAARSLSHRSTCCRCETCPSSHQTFRSIRKKLIRPPSPQRSKTRCAIWSSIKQKTPSLSSCNGAARRPSRGLTLSRVGFLMRSHRRPAASVQSSLWETPMWVG